jgi:hypothetical protein
MKIHSLNFRVAEEEKVNLNKWPTDVKPIYTLDPPHCRVSSDRGNHAWSRRTTEFFVDHDLKTALRKKHFWDRPKSDG